MTIAFNTVGTFVGKSENNVTAIVVTANDTTTPVNSRPIGNTDGQLSFISAMFTATNQTGTSPTLQLTLQGSDDGATWTNLKDSAGNVIQTTAISINTASTTNVNGYIDTVANPRASFPQFLRLSVGVGGSATPGGTYTVSYKAVRSAYRSAGL